MTHEYVIALGGAILGASRAGREASHAAGHKTRREDAPAPSAIGWAADRVLAVGSDEIVRAISRGDSTFLDISGRAVTPLPADTAGAERLLRAAVTAGSPFRATEVLQRAGLLDPASVLEPGSPADLAFWSLDPETTAAAAAESLRIVAVVRAGAFTEGDEHCGPFPHATGRGGSGTG